LEDAAVAMDEEMALQDWGGTEVEFQSGEKDGGEEEGRESAPELQVAASSELRSVARGRDGRRRQKEGVESRTRGDRPSPQFTDFFGNSAVQWFFSRGEREAWFSSLRWVVGRTNNHHL
jgi:hypothetical protein